MGIGMKSESTTGTGSEREGPADAVAPTGAWTWTTRQPPPRYSGAVFRLACQIGVDVRSAELQLSARTRYRLSVNGETLGSGPARSMPAWREADPYDIRPFLRVGRNVIEVEVRHTDFATFHHQAEPPGFLAWGAILERGGRSHDLATPGAWRCRPLAGLADDAPQLSFAQGPVEIHDLRGPHGPEGIRWRKPVVVGSGHGGELVSRALPPLTRIPVMVSDARYWPEQAASDLVDGRAAWRGNGRSEDAAKRAWAAARGWIWSPSEQTVVCSTWWGRMWVGGSLQHISPKSSLALAQTLTLRVRAGWQRFVALGEILFGHWEFCLAVPHGSGLLVRTAPQADACPGVEVAGPFRGEPPTPCPESEACPGLGVEDSAWRVACQSVADGGSPLRSLAWLREPPPKVAASLPVTLPPGAAWRVVADLGTSVLGPITLDVEAGEGTVVDIGHAEQADPDGRPDYAKAVTVYPADRFVLAGGSQRIETFEPRGFRHLELRVSGHATPVTIRRLGAVEERYPYVFQGEFECSDPDFNRLWVYARRTLELCSEDVLTDCPWRERTLYAGDLLAEMGATVAQTRDLRLVRRSLDVLLQAADPVTGWIPGRAPGEGDAALADYPLLALVSMAWLLRLSDDPAFARRAWSVGRKLADTLEGFRDANGLYDPPMRAFIDHGRRLTTGPTAAFNAACVAAWRALAEIAQAAGDAGAVAGLNRRADQLEGRFEDAYFDREAGLFRDLPLRNGGHETEGSPAVVWPLLFAPGVHRLSEACMPALRRMLEGFDPAREARSVSPYQMFYLLALLRTLGEGELAEDTIRSVYAAMLDTPTGTLWENALPDKSLAHAWSCGPSDYFATAVLGVRMGFESAREISTVQVRPCVGSLRWARGSVPHPRGDIRVEWEREGQRLQIHVEAPEGVSVDIQPAGRLSVPQGERRLVRTRVPSTGSTSMSTQAMIGQLAKTSRCMWEWA